MVNVARFAEDHSGSASCANPGAARDAREGKELVEPLTPLPSRVSQGEGVWKWSKLMCRYAVVKMKSLMMTVVTL